MTGSEFSSIFDLKIDKAYSGFLNSTKKNRLFKEALILAIETKYKNLSGQKQFDEIINLIKTEQSFVPVSNVLSLISAGVTDYQHLLSIKAKFTEPIPGITIKSINGTSPATITISGTNNIRTGESYVISGVLGMLNINGTVYLKRLNSTTFSLYSNSGLTVPVIGTGTYSSGGTFNKVYYNYCKPSFSDRKISTLGEPTINYPKFEMTQNSVKIYPLDKTCTEVKIDYIIKPTVFIDSANSLVDLELTYPIKFLYYVADVSAQLFSESVKDQELFQTSTFETNTNN